MYTPKMTSCFENYMQHDVMRMYRSTACRLLANSRAIAGNLNIISCTVEQDYTLDRG